MKIAILTAMDSEFSQIAALLDDKQEVADYIDGVSPGFLDGDAYIISAPNHYGASYVMDELVAVGRLEKKAERLYRIKK